MQSTPATTPPAPDSGDVLANLQSALADPQHAGKLLQPVIDGALSFGAKALGALVVLVIGLWIAGRLRRAIATVVGRSKVDQTLAAFFASLAYYVALALVVITTLGVFGVPTTSFAALIGAAGLAIGLALQGTLGHIAAGVMLLIFRPFSIGNYVIVNGMDGTVSSLNLFFTELTTVDNKRLTIPNGQVWDGAITNFSANPTRRLDIVFGVAYEADLDQAIAAIRAEIEADERSLKDPTPVVEVDSWGDSSVNITSRTWCAGADYFPLKWSLMKKVKERFDRENIGIPFPCRTVYMANPPASDA